MKTVLPRALGQNQTKITKHINLHELRGPQSRDRHLGGCVWEPLGLIIEEQKYRDGRRKQNMFTAPSQRVSVKKQN
jgi:hypothetical protein